MPGYTEWRKFCGLPQVRTFEDLRDVMSGGSVTTLRATYGSIEDIDLFTGGLAEVPTKGAVVGPTFACLLGRQMYYFKSGRVFFWLVTCVHNRVTRFGYFIAKWLFLRALSKKVFVSIFSKLRFLKHFWLFLTFLGGF